MCIAQKIFAAEWKTSICGGDKSFTVKINQELKKINRKMKFLVRSVTLYAEGGH